MVEDEDLDKGKEINQDQDRLSEDELEDVAGGKLASPPEPE